MCPSLRVLHLESMALRPALFGALAQVEELYIHKCFWSHYGDADRSVYKLAFTEAVLPMRSLRTLCLDIKVLSLSGVELLPELHHLQLGKLYMFGHSHSRVDLGLLAKCPKLESVTFLISDLHFFSSATLKRLVCLHRSLFFPNSYMRACSLGCESTEGVSLPALESFEMEKAYLCGRCTDPQVLVAAHARLARFMGIAAPNVVLHVRTLIIGAEHRAARSVPNNFCVLEPLHGRFQVQRLDCTIQLSDSELQQLASLLPSGMQHVRLPLTGSSLSAACLASVVLRWRVLGVLELEGAFEDARLVWSLCDGVQRCPQRQRPLQVRLLTSSFDLCDESSDAERRQSWMSRWQQAALRFASSGRPKVQLYID